MNLPDLVANAVARFPDRTCVIAGGRTLTFGDVDSRAARLAGALGDHGVRAGDRLALLARNEPEYFEIQIAAQRAGVMLVPLNYRLATAEFKAIVRDCQPAALIYGAEHAEQPDEFGLPVSTALLT